MSSRPVILLSVKTLSITPSLQLGCDFWMVIVRAGKWLRKNIGF